MMEFFRVSFHRLLLRSTRDETGVTAMEYGLVATAIAVVVAAGVAGLGPKVIALFVAIGA